MVYLGGIIILIFQRLKEAKKLAQLTIGRGDSKPTPSPSEAFAQLGFLSLTCEVQLPAGTAGPNCVSVIPT